MYIVCQTSIASLMSQQSSLVSEVGADLENHDHDNTLDHYHEWEEDEANFLLPGVGTESESESESCLKSPDADAAPEGAHLTPEGVATLIHRWNYYYHLPNDKNWNLDSYKIIMANISTVQQLIAMNESLTDNIIKNCMLFVMRAGITPMWEDPQNRQGGCFSYKVTNKTVISVWRRLTYLLCGYSLTTDPAHMDWVNGITISPKRGFCIIKIWMRNCNLQDPAVIVNVEQLMRNGCLFKSHTPEF
jgi:Eukaryotic initiation factor 4E